MTKKKDHSTDITKVSPDLSLPTFMEEEELTSLDTLKQYIVPPFIKVVQKQASDELLKSFGVGDVILSPTNAIIAEMPRDTKGRPLDGARSSFLVVPIFFYPEWITWNPIELRGSEPSIRYRTIDSNDPIVAKSRNPALREESHPSNPTLKIRHCEHLNFVVVLYKHPLGGESVILSFARSLWKSGSKFASQLKMRKAPIFGCVFEVVVTPMHNQFGDWFGFNTCNPGEGSPWVTQEEYEVFKTTNAEFTKYHQEARIQAQYDDTLPEDEAAAGANKEF